MDILLQNTCQSILLILGFKDKAEYPSIYRIDERDWGYPKGYRQSIKTLQYYEIKRRNHALLPEDYLPDLLAEITANNYQMIIYIVLSVTGGMPEMVFEYVLKRMELIHKRSHHQPGY